MAMRSDIPAEQQCAAPAAGVPVVIVMNRHADAIIDTDQFASTYENIAGQPLIHNKKAAVAVDYDEDDFDNVGARVDGWRWKNYSATKRDLPSFVWKPTVPSQIALARGYVSTFDYLTKIQIPDFERLVFVVTLKGADVQLRAKLTPSITYDGRIAIRGDAHALRGHPGVLNFTEYDLRWKEPFWISDDASYDPERILHFCEDNSNIVMHAPSERTKRAGPLN
jgi:hypothetical protein